MRPSLLCTLLLGVFSVVSSLGLFHSRKVSLRQAGMSTTRLHGRVAKPAESENKKAVIGTAADEEVGSAGVGGDDDDDMITVPFEGLVGRNQGGGLFNKALEIEDPTEAVFANVSGVPGSPEYEAAIGAVINARLEALKRGELDDIQVEKDPMEGVTMWKMGFDAIRTTRPFDSASDFALTLILINIALFSVFSYTYAVNSVLQIFVDWWIKTDFSESPLGVFLRL